MADNEAWPSEIRLEKGGEALRVSFEDGAGFTLGER
jgi:DUF971 family protein